MRDSKRRRSRSKSRGFITNFGRSAPAAAEEESHYGREEGAES
jgi:hypothetical protein